MSERKKEESFGEYFDTQYNNLRKSLENRNAQLWKEWKERYESEKNKKMDSDGHSNSVTPNPSFSAMSILYADFGFVTH